MPQSYASASGGSANDLYKPQRLQNDPQWSPLDQGVNGAGQTPAQALSQAQAAVTGGRYTDAYNKATGKAPTVGGYSVGPNGEVSYQVKEDPFAAHLSQLSQMGLMTGSQSGGDAGPHIEHPGLDQGAEAAARDAAFGRAKDRAAMVAQSGLKSLQNIMASRGLQGSSIERTGTMNAIEAGVGQLGGVLRSQAENEAGRAGDIADMNFQGGIQQRGQDIQAKQAQQQALISLINAAGGAY